MTPISILKRAVEKNHVAHAFLFYGSDISTQLETALWLACSLNCHQFNKSSGPCGECGSCSKIMRSTHPDVTVHVPQGALRIIRIEQIRKIQEEACYRPFEGKAKIVIIQEADLLHLAAANALLKILEEPPSFTFFILLTTHPESVLATIQSRCQGVQFKGLAQFFDLKAFPECEGDTAFLEALRVLSGGSEKVARRLINEGIWEKRKAILKMFLQTLKGETWVHSFSAVEKMVEVFEDEMELLEETLGKEGDTDLDSEYKKNREDERKAFLAGERLRGIDEIFCLVLAWAGDERKGIPKDELPRLVDAVEEARRLIRRGANLKWVIEAIVMKLRTAECGLRS